MAFFEDLGKQLSQAAQAVTKRTSEAAEIGKLNGKRMDIEAQIDELYSKIGKAYYATRGAEAGKEALDAICAEIDKLQLRIVDIGRAIDRLKHQRRCTQCGEIQPDESRYCSSCGAQLPGERAVIVPEAHDDGAEDVKPDEVGEPIHEEGAQKGDVNVEITWPSPSEEEKTDQ